MNADSSRSHSVFIITTEQNDGSLGVKKCGRMYLVDLAGSETVSKTNASGQTLQVRGEEEATATTMWCSELRRACSRARLLAVLLMSCSCRS